MVELMTAGHDDGEADQEEVRAVLEHVLHDVMGELFVELMGIMGKAGGKVHVCKLPSQTQVLWQELPRPG